MNHKIIVITILVVILNGITTGQKKYLQSDNHNINNVTGYYSIMRKQGYVMTVWLANNGQLGCGSLNQCSGLNLEYPVGSGIEHLYAGGLLIGGIIDNSARVTKTYSFFDERDETKGVKNYFWQTSIDTLNDHNQRYVDDDQDGMIDEDELDGDDNDGDWNPDTDDVGSDGLSDPFEMSCDGKPYDPLTNPDPAGDNYNPNERDKCHPNPDGGYPYKNNIEIYTEKNGRPDHGEPNVDEDYGAVSENDLYCAYTDTFSRPTFPLHFSMGLKVFQKSYAWQNRVKEPILPIEYTVVNVGRKTWRDVYIGYFLDADVGPVDMPDFFEHNYSSYFDSLTTAYVQNPIDRGSTPLGFTVLSCSKRLDSLRYFFTYEYLPTMVNNDSLLYFCYLQGCPAIDPPILPPSSDVRFYFSLGPFKEIKPGDTLNFSIALVSGDCVAECPNNLVENAKKAIILYNRNFNLPTPPSPPLRIKMENEKVKLDWKWREGDQLGNPEEYWDEYHSYLGTLPDTNWRRQNPPNGRTRGGRNFEGYKVWRCESEFYQPKMFQLLAQYDIDDELGYGDQTGLQHSCIDSNVHPTRSYWYAVTSFSVPEGIILPLRDDNGVIYLDTIFTEGHESNLQANATKVNISFATSTENGKVKVVPNPYRGDVFYTDGNGYEGYEFNWTPEKRVIWFIHLPKYATIRVYSIVGEIITTIRHNDDERIAHGLPPGQEEFRLFASSGRPLASGVYVFTVDSEFGQQIGKFVIIK